MTCPDRGNTAVLSLFDTADVVLHRPTKEKWVVAFVRGDRLTCCGWPESVAPISDCVLVKKATPEQRFNHVQDMAAMPGSDSRKSHALEQLKQAEQVLPGKW